MFVFVVLGGVTGLPSSCRVASARLSTHHCRDLCIERQMRSGVAVHGCSPSLWHLRLEGFRFRPGLRRRCILGAAALDIILNP